jgi:hypothetical protein
MVQAADRSESIVSTVDLVDALVHFEAARIALRCQFEGSLGLYRGEYGLPESVVPRPIPRMTSVGAT